MLSARRDVKPLALGVLAVLVALGGVVVLPAAPAGAAADDGRDVSDERYGGADRYATSLMVAEAFAADAGGSLSSVVLVSGERWTDAVVAAPVAGSLGAPVLMTPPGELRADARRFLERVGVSSAVVVGPQEGGGAHGSGRGVDAAVLTELSEAGIRAERVAGADRFATSIEAAREVTPGVMPGLGRTAIVASGEVFADALVAGPFAARGIHPVLLSRPDALPADVASYLGAGEITHVVVMGGTAALSADVETAVKDLGVEVTRLAGANRFDTAVKAAELITGRYSNGDSEDCFTTSTIGIARARVPFDSFSAAPLLGRLCAPLVLTDPKQIPDDTAAFLDAAREAHDTINLRVFGGDVAVSQAAIDAYLGGAESSQRETGAGGPDDAEPGVLPAGSCGGSAADPPSRLVHDPMSQDPAWAPDCTKIAYASGDSIWTADIDGSGARRAIPNEGAVLYTPAWSPDGSKIAYGRGSFSGEGHWERHIWVANADGTGRAQLTSGDVWDETPAWSPDGTRVVFSRVSGSGRDDQGNRIAQDRHIAIVEFDGRDVQVLSAGGLWERHPAWSPDGSWIAYVSSGSEVRVMRPDGSDSRTVAGEALWSGGMAWSPDGTQLAYARDGGTSAIYIVVVEVDGIGERRITDLDGFALDPKWSPDGQLIAFTHYDQTGGPLNFRGTRYLAVAGSAGTRVLTDAEMCKPRGRNGTTAGFPLPNWTPSKGTVRVAVLFVDFPDAPAAHTTHEEAALGLPWAEEYLEKSSYRKLDLEYVPHHTWLRAPQNYVDYLKPSVQGFRHIGAGFTDVAVDLIDDEIDFSGFHSVAVVLPSTHFRSGVAGNVVEADGVWILAHINNNAPRSEPSERLLWWGSTAAHELTHNLGLLDMYPYDSSLHTQPDPPSGHKWVHVRFGQMGLTTSFLAADNDERLLRRTRLPDGRTSTYYGFSGFRDALEMLAWSRWQLGWLNQRQVECITADAATVTLAPVARTGGAVAMAAVPIERQRVIVIESRREIGYDQDDILRALSGAVTNFPRLLEEGVLVYTVDTRLGSGQQPVKIAGDSGNGQVDDYPVLQAGESVTVAGWTITVTADDGDTHTVTVSRNG